MDVEKVRGLPALLTLAMLAPPPPPRVPPLLGGAEDLAGAWVCEFVIVYMCVLHMRVNMFSYFKKII